MDISRAVPTTVKTISSAKQKSVYSSMKVKIGGVFSNKKKSQEQRLQIARDRWKKLSTLKKALGIKPFKSLGCSKFGRKSTMLYVTQESTLDPDDHVRRRLIIYPEDKWKGVFDFIISILILYFCLIVPYRIGFTLELSSL